MLRNVYIIVYMYVCMYSCVYVMLRRAIIPGGTVSSHHQAAIDHVVLPAVSYLQHYYPLNSHASTHARSCIPHAARPQAQAIPGAHPSINMHNESLVTGHPNDGASALSLRLSTPLLARLLALLALCLDRTVELPLDTTPSTHRLGRHPANTLLPSPNRNTPHPRQSGHSPCKATPPLTRSKATLVWRSFVLSARHTTTPSCTR